MNSMVDVAGPADPNSIGRVTDAFNAILSSCASDAIFSELVQSLQ